LRAAVLAAKKAVALWQLGINVPKSFLTLADAPIE
jgi:hypothetical protein